MITTFKRIFSCLLLFVSPAANAEVLQRVFYTITTPPGCTIDPAEPGLSHEALTVINFPDGGTLSIAVVEDKSELGSIIDGMAREVANQYTNSKISPPTLSANNRKREIIITGSVQGLGVTSIFLWHEAPHCAIITSYTALTSDEAELDQLRLAAASLKVRSPNDMRSSLKDELRRQISESTQPSTSQPKSNSRPEPSSPSTSTRAAPQPPILPKSATSQQAPQVVEPFTPPPRVVRTDPNKDRPNRNPLPVTPNQSGKTPLGYGLKIDQTPPSAAQSPNTINNTTAPRPATTPSKNVTETMIFEAQEQGVAQSGISAAITSSRFVPPLEVALAAYAELGRPSPDEMRQNPAYNTYLAGLIASNMLTVPGYDRKVHGWDGAIKFVDQVSNQQIRQLHDAAIQGAIYRYRNKKWEEKFGPLHWKDPNGREVAVSEFLRRTKDYEKLREVYLIASRHE